MRILLVHNSYRQRGGEDAVFEAERDLLVEAGHEVLEYHVHNDAVARMGRARLLATTVWSRGARRDLRRLVRAQRPDVAHFHNTLPLVSPAAYAAVRREGVPVVQTLHNYRMICPSALLFRDGSVCEDCVGRAVAWPAVRHGCYRQSRAASAAVAAMLAVHRALGTWRDDVDVWVALTGFQRDLVARGGIPRDKITVLPNFLARDPGVERGERARAVVLFVGRLTEEKGLRVLLDASAHLPRTARLRIAGDGPLRSLVAERAARDPRIEILGALGPEQVDAEMRRATVLAVPSLWYEGLPMTVVEAYARGLPVVASALGGLSEVVEDGVQGRSVRPGNPSALGEVLAEVIADREATRQMGDRARDRFEAAFTPGVHLDGLIRIYQRAALRRPGPGDFRPDPDSSATNMTTCPPSRRSTACRPLGR